MLCIQHQIIRIPHICQNFTVSKIKTTMLQTKFPLTHGMFQTCIKQHGLITSPCSHHVEWGRFFHSHPLSDCNTVPPEVSDMGATHLVIVKHQTMMNIQCGQMLSSNLSLQTKQGNSIPRTCCKHFPIPQRHPLHLCMVGIQLDLWTDASPMLASIACKPVLQKFRM